MSSSYFRGTNLVGALTSVIGEEALLNVYTGKEKFSDLINNYDKNMARGHSWSYWYNNIIKIKIY